MLVSMTTVKLGLQGANVGGKVSVGGMVPDEVDVNVFANGIVLVFGLAKNPIKTEQVIMTEKRMKGCIFFSKVQFTLFNTQNKLKN